MNRLAHYLWIVDNEFYGGRHVTRCHMTEAVALSGSFGHPVRVEGSLEWRNVPDPISDDESERDGLLGERLGRRLSYPGDVVRGEEPGDAVHAGHETQGAPKNRSPFSHSMR